MFTDHDNKYYSIGAQPGGAERGVQSGLHKLKHNFPNHHWDYTRKVLKRAEYAFDMFMDTEVIQHHACKTTCEVSNNGTISFFVTCKVCKILQCCWFQY